MEETTARESVETLAGYLLIAVPQLQDPNFHRSVVLMLEHGEDGALGLVINTPLTAPLSDVAESLDLVWEGDPDATVRSGGPVEPIRGWVLHDRENWDLDSHDVFPGIQMTTSLEAIKRSGNQCFGGDGGSFLFILGYAGWAGGQLEGEIAAGSWVLVPLQGVTSPDDGPGVATQWLFDADPDDMWRDALLSIGVDPQRLVGLQGSGHVMQ